MSKLMNIETTHGSISCLSRDGSPQYVLIHGLGGYKDIFSPAFAHPNAANKGLLSVDMLGFGSSSRLDGSIDYTFDLQANALREALSCAGIRKFNLVVHSMSSALIPELFTFDELEIQTLFLLEGNVLPEDPGWSKELSDMSDDEFHAYFMKIQKGARFVMASQMRRKHSRESLEQWSKGYLHADARAMRHTAVELYQRTRDGVIAEAVSGFDGRKVYFRGIDDRDWNGYDTLEGLGVEVVRVPNAGHQLMLDDPETIYDEIFR